MVGSTPTRFRQIYLTRRKLQNNEAAKGSKKGFWLRFLCYMASGTDGNRISQSRGAKRGGRHRSAPPLPISLQVRVAFGPSLPRRPLRRGRCLFLPGRPGQRDPFDSLQYSRELRVRVKENLMAIPPVQLSTQTWLGISIELPNIGLRGLVENMEAHFFFPFRAGVFLVWTYNERLS